MPEQRFGGGRVDILALLNGGERPPQDLPQQHDTAPKSNATAEEIYTAERKIPNRSERGVIVSAAEAGSAFAALFSNEALNRMQKPERKKSLQEFRNALVAGETLPQEPLNDILVKWCNNKLKEITTGPLCGCILAMQKERASQTYCLYRVTSTPSTSGGVPPQDASTLPVSEKPPQQRKEYPLYYESDNEKMTTEITAEQLKLLIDFLREKSKSEKIINKILWREIIESVQQLTPESNKTGGVVFTNRSGIGIINRLLSKCPIESPLHGYRFLRRREISLYCFAHPKEQQHDIRDGGSVTE